MVELTKVLRSYSDGFGCRVFIEHNEHSGYIRIADETPGREPWGLNFLPQELEELGKLIQSAADHNREQGIYPYKGKTAVIDGMPVQVIE